jgi:hypothetical protein
MTSESDSTSGRPPPTIELKATEVEPPKPRDTAPQDTAEATAKADADTQDPSEPNTSEPKSAAQSRGSFLPHAISAAIGAVAAAAVLVGLWLAGFTVARDVVSQALPTEATLPNATNTEVAARLDKIERALAAPKPEAPAIPTALANRLAAVEMQAKMLGDSSAALNHRLDDIAAAAQAAQKQATSAAAAAADAAKSAGQTSTQPADLEALTNRIAALESAVKSLSEQIAHPAAGDDRAARLMIAAQALRTTVEAGAPYGAELKAVLALGADKSATTPLDAFAPTGVPPRAALVRELTALVPALRQAAAPSPGETTFLGKLKANAWKLTRIEIDADRAEISAALKDIAALPDQLKPLTADWAKKAQAREDAIAASRKVAADALAGLSTAAAQ